ncbi:VPLPA-CTERM sorting domain-containing protein [Paracoccus sp. SSK6]|uniref:VPLPA-CTERM sorting domain-containing protein n=1 Tax=Paracoccus sp. SSK6 TaxID=3143131 RepID=UPI003219F556
MPGAPAGGTPVDLTVDDFERVGNCGGGAAVINDGCSVVVKTDPSTPDAMGRFDPLGKYWIDSQDINDLKWTVSSEEAFTSMTFALTDAHDQLDSFFTMFFDDGGSWDPIWNIATQKSNASLYWLSVDFGKAVNEAVFLFSTKVEPGYDGFGISALTLEKLAPVPLPPAALLLGSGTMLMAGLRRRRKGNRQASAPQG